MNDRTEKGKSRAVSGEVRRLLDIMAALRDPASGCPWDREQDSNASGNINLSKVSMTLPGHMNAIVCTRDGIPQTRAAGFQERFFGCAETALSPSPALLWLRRNRTLSIACAALLLVLVTMLGGCQRSSDPEPASQRSDAGLSQPLAKPNGQQWDARLNEIKRQLAQSQRFTPELFESLQRLHNDAPQHDPTTRLLVKAYLQRQDWNALADLLTSKSAQKRTARDDQQLAAILVRAQRYEEAFALVEPMVDEAGQSTHLDAAWLAAFSAFHTGNLARAGTILDANFEELIAAGKLDAYVIRALVHFEFGELAQAETLLTALVDQNDSHAPGHDALGRVLVARGDVERGKRHIERASELRRQATTAEQKALRLAAMSKALDAAWNRKEYDTCDRFIAEMLPQVSRDQQIVLYQYLAAVRRAQGRQEEAREAQQRADQLSTGQSES